MGLFKSKKSAADLALDALDLSREKGLHVLDKVLRYTERTGSADVALVQGRVDEFLLLWLYAMCLVARLRKGPEAARIALAADQHLTATIPGAALSRTQIAQIVERLGRSDGSFGLIASEIFVKVYPEFSGHSEQIQLLSGIELVSTLNYLDFLLQRYKVI